MWQARVVAIAATLCAFTGGQRNGVASGNQASDREGPLVVQRAPTERAIAIRPGELQAYLREMDRKGIEILRLVDGGKFAIDIRRIGGAKTAIAHTKMADVWVVMEGRGTFTSGGVIDSGKIVRGDELSIGPGDVCFIPAGLSHGVTAAERELTWLSVRWDVDWPAGAELGAGRRPGVGSGSVAAGSPAGPLQDAPSDRAVHISGEALKNYLSTMEAKGQAVLRLLEGGHFNVNIRRVKTPSAERHPITVDTWVVLEGGGVVNTGFVVKDGRPVYETGSAAPATVGDLFFIPANLFHGFSTVNGVAAWLNIRWDVNWGTGAGGGEELPQEGRR